MKKSLCFLSICFAALACCSACIQHNNPENPADPKTEITNAVRAACCRVYREEVVVGAKGEAMRRLEAVGRALLVAEERKTLKGGEQEDDFCYAIIAFNKFQENVPDALYFGGENGEETVKVENIEMVTPTLGVSVIGAIFAGLGVEPIAATVNHDGAPADNYLVDLKTIEPDRMASIDVRRTEEVENNLEKFAEKCFLDLVFQQNQVFATGVSQVLKAVADGGSYPKVYYERLIQFGGKK